MKKVLTVLTLLLAAHISQAQTTGMDFNRMDCNGTNRHLFADLDSGKVVILEFFMGPNCNSCMVAASEIEGMKTQLLAAHPGKVMTYAMGYQNSYSCATITNWVTSQSLTAIPMDSAATQVAYYGGFSMPTIVVLAGTNHNIIYTANPNNGGYTPGDTSTMSTNIKNFFNPTGVQNVGSSVSAVNVYPNPAKDVVSLSLNVTEQTDLTVQLVCLSGQVISNIVNEKVKTGVFNTTFSTANIASGIYMIRIVANGNTTFEKLNIVK